MQRWLSGLRRTIGNRVYLVRVPRVQIPLSAPEKSVKMISFCRFFAILRGVLKV